MKGLLFDVIPERDLVLILLDDRIAEVYGCAGRIADALDRGIIDIGSVVTINERRQA